MKNLLDEKMKKYIVVTCEGYDEYFITHRDNFKDVELCECYGNYGQKIGCYNAGCYSTDNSSGDFSTNFMKAFNEKYPDSGIDSIDTILEGNNNEYIEFYEGWKKENTAHTQVKAWTYWDGRNFKSLVIENDFGGENDVSELEEDEQRKILAEFDGQVDVFRGHSASQETENYIFTTTKWQSDQWLANVKSK